MFASVGHNTSSCESSGCAVRYQKRLRDQLGVVEMRVGCAGMSAREASQGSGEPQNSTTRNLNLAAVCGIVKANCWDWAALEIQLRGGCSQRSAAAASAG